MFQSGWGNGRQFGDGFGTEFANACRRLGADAPEFRDGQRAEKPFDIVERYDNHPIGFFQIRGDFGQKLVGSKANRRRQVRFVLYLDLDVLRDLLGGPISAIEPVMSRNASSMLNGSIRSV